jgi:hypothetical protein
MSKMGCLFSLRFRAARTETTIQKRFLVIGNGNLINSFIISILFLSNAVALGLAIGFNSLYSGILVSKQGIRKTQLLLLLISNIDYSLTRSIVINPTCPVSTRLPILP